MKIFGSIRWRLQLWHGLTLALVLTGFGTVIWQLQASNAYQQIDRELERRVAAVTATMHDGDPLPPRRQQPRGGDPAGRRPPGRGPEGGGPDADIYYIAWSADGRELTRSATAPTDVSMPDRLNGQRTQRLRGTAREYVFFTPQGECVLIGRDIQTELLALRGLLWLIIGAGSAVFVLGWVGGWWVSTRALRPIIDISATASRISTGDLSQRISTPDAGNELAELADVLNDTFGRLQAGFVRQARFTADASHELRTPVAVVLTQTQSALARTRSIDEYRESLAACERAARRMSSLIESLLTLARLDTGEPTVRVPCALDRIAAETVELLRPLAEEQGLALTAVCGAAPCNGDSAQLGQVATNLIDNALGYSPRGGTVHVTTSAEGASVVLTVSDTGIGIAAEDLPHIFERFYRADRSRSRAQGRSGLGLAITKAIIDAHGGTIQVASEVNRGTTVRVTLPARH